MTFKISVEPVAFLYLLTSFMIMTGTQDLIYTKICYTHYPSDVCENLYAKENAKALNTVQSYSSYWMLGWNLVFTLPSVFSGQFIGAWSDSYGVKTPMLIPPTGNALSAVIYLCQSVYMKEAPVSLVLIASLVAGVCGGTTVCILTCLNYVSKVTNVNERTVRVSIIEAMIFLAGFGGPLLAGWIQTTFGRTYLYLIVTAIQVVIVFYIAVYVADISPRYPVEDSVRKVLSLKHLRDSVMTIMKPRPEKRRFYILLLASSMIIVKLCKASMSLELITHLGELDVTYIYLKDKPMEWNFSSYTHYVSMTHALGSISLLCLLPFLRNQTDTVLLVLGLISYLSGFILLGLATNSVMVYSVAVVSSLSSWCLPVIRSSVSKLLDNNELGKIFACLATIENISLLVGTSLFNGLYPLTRQIFHGFVFIIAAALLIIPIVTCSYLHNRLKILHSYTPVMESVTKEFEEDDDGEYNDESILSSTFSVTSQINLLDDSSQPNREIST